MQKGVGISGLSSEKTYVQLKDGFRESLFDGAHNYFDNWRILGEFLGIKRGDTTIARNWKEGMNCYPLNIVLKIGNLINITKKEIEKNIIQIRYKTQIDGGGGSSGGPINNPNFPIKIDGDFAEMLGHICGDGTIVRCRPEKGIRTSYSNSEIELIKGFDFLMKKIFGEVESYLYNVDISSQVVKTSFTYTKPHYQISYPTIISYLILSVYDYKYNDKMEFPEFILDLDEKARCGFLRALFDDEGYVNEKHKVVRIGMKPFNFMKGVDRTLNSVGIETKGIRREKDKMYYIKIYNKKNQILYSKKINFKHPLKKKRLKKLINFIK